ncbi:unnamed protein product [Dibothriocephalus latus]|uniref:Non-specific serine/threonine protein kinase n=1 Tax=Dibothriocephalus latus TaxID=60516 RepID=A0A3P7RCG3_DIBLA|nr:unnamed protein product [Dibothriocephalus latus]
MHWLNVLVKPTKQEKLRYRVGGVSYAVQTEGIHVCIIDFTVSRLCHEGNIVYVDMSKSPEVFECEGDYQFDIYRMMRDMNGLSELAALRDTVLSGSYKSATQLVNLSFYFDTCRID